MTLLLLILASIPFYLLGTFPTGKLLAHMRGVDITREGSGNVGATNVARTLGKRAGLMTLLGDIGKGFLAPLLATLISDTSDFIALSSFMVIAGHCYSIPGKSKGGKGVATCFGAFLYLSPSAALLSLVVFLGVVTRTKIVSLASVTAILLAPIFGLFLEGFSSVTLALMGASIIVTSRHKENLERLAAGQEKKFSSGNPKEQN